MSGTKTTTRLHSRRSFLAMSAAASASTFLSTQLVPSIARAAPNVAPLRLILLHSSFEMPEAFYHPQISATNSALAPAGSSFYLDFPNSILAPLSPFQSDLIIFRGLKYGGGPNSHDSNPTTFSGYPTSPGADSLAAGQSTIDQYLFSRMAKLGSLSPFLAGALSYLFADQCYNSDIVFNNGNPVAQIGNPLKFYNSLFANFVPNSSQAPSSSTVRSLARRQQTLGLVQKHLKGMMGELPSSSPSYAVLQSHWSAAQGLAAQLGGSSSVNLASCSPPVSSSLSNDTGPDNSPLVGSKTDPDIASFIQVIVQALACDITRFGAMKMGDSGDPSQVMVNSMPGLTNWNQSDNFHAIASHSSSGAPSDLRTQQMAAYKRYFMTQAANLLSALKAVADPFSPTQSLYDNTVVLIGSEGPIHTIGGSDVHGNGDPNSDQPFIVAGGCGGYFKRGQLVFAGGNKTGTVNHNALLTNIVNAFEQNQQAFNPSYQPNIVNQYGSYSFSVSPTSWLG